jgi:hypothetical protein
MHRMFACLVLLVIAGFSQTGPAAKPVSPSTKKSSQGFSASSDAALEKDIRARFARSKINADKFEPRVQGGVVTITGKTDIVQHKGTATRLARNAGAAKVVNQIQVSEAGKQRASENLASGGRRGQVKRSDVPGRK